MDRIRLGAWLAALVFCLAVWGLAVVGLVMTMSGG